MPLAVYSLRSLDLISSGAAETGEVLAVMAKLGVDKTHDDVCQAWYNEWNAMAVSLEKRAKDAEAAGHKVTAASCYLRATEYHRQSFFFLRDNLDDPRIAEASKAVQTCFQAYIRLSGAPLQTVAIPYDDAKTLDGYFAPGKGSKPGEKRPVAVIVGDYDGCAEEHWLTTGRFAWERGYHVLVFDGPGQGSSLWQKDIYFPEAVETSVDAAAAFLAASKPEADLSKVILLGRKYGGYLAMHTAGAVAKRGSGPYTIAAVAVAPLYMNMGERTNPQILMTPQLKAAFAEGNEEYVNTELKSLMSQLCTVRFSVSHIPAHGPAFYALMPLFLLVDCMCCVASV